MLIDEGATNLRLTPKVIVLKNTSNAIRVEQYFRRKIVLEIQFLVEKHYALLLMEICNIKSDQTFRRMQFSFDAIRLKR